jgi:hypothetical protein
VSFQEGRGSWAWSDPSARKSKRMTSLISFRV